MTTDAEWPLSVRPSKQSFFVEACTGRFVGLSGQVLVREQPGARWRAKVEFPVSPADAPRIEALLAACRGGVGALLMPDWTRLSGTGSLASFDDYAAEIGPTRFDDRTDFDDGTALFEGAGTPRLAGGAWRWLVLTGCRPGATDVVGLGDLVRIVTGQAVTVVVAGTVDLDGILVLEVAPHVRTEPVPGALVTDTVRVRMVLDADGIDCTVTPPAKRLYRLSLSERL